MLGLSCIYDVIFKDKSHLKLIWINFKLYFQFFLTLKMNHAIYQNNHCFT